MSQFVQKQSSESRKIFKARYDSTSTFNRIQKHLQNAILRINPVVVSIEGIKDRFASFTDALVEQDNTLSLILQPFPSQAIEENIHLLSSSVWIKSSDEKHPWAIKANSITVQKNEELARIKLGDVSLLETLPKRVARLKCQAQNSLALIATSGTGISNIFTFPLIDLSKDGCCIESEKPWQIGGKIPRIDIVGSSNLRLRTGSAQVVDSFPWHPPKGKTRFRCRLAIQPFSDQSNFEGEKIDNKQTIEQIFYFAALQKCRGVLSDIYGNSATIQFTEISDGLLHLHPEGSFRKLDWQSPFQLKFELLNTCYIFSFLLCKQDNLLKLHIPNVIQVVHRRWLPRFKVPLNEDIDFVFKSAENPIETSRKVVDISVGGLSFETKVQQDLLWPNLRLHDCCVRYGKERFFLGEYEVKEVVYTPGKSVCHVVYQAGPQKSLAELTQRIVQLRYPSLSLYTEKDFDQLVSLSEESGILHEHMKKNFPEETAINWSKLSQSNGEIGSIFLHKDEHDNRIDASITAVRTWNHTMVAQHLIAVGSQKSQLANQLRQVCLENTLVQNQIGYLLFFVKDGKNSSTFQYDYFIDTMQNHSSAEHCKIHLWVVSPNSQRPYYHNQYSFNPPEKSHELLIQHAAEREFGTLTADALSLKKDEIDLSKVSNLYKKVGLDRFRTTHLVFQGGAPIYAILNENMSPGLNLTWLLNAFWILPIASSGVNQNDCIQESIGYILNNFPTRSTTGEYFIITPKDQWIDVNSMKGFNIRHEMTIRCYTLSLAGVNRLYDFMNERYGILNQAS